MLAVKPPLMRCFIGDEVNKYIHLLHDFIVNVVVAMTAPSIFISILQSKC